MQSYFHYVPLRNAILPENRGTKPGSVLSVTGGLAGSQKIRSQTDGQDGGTLVLADSCALSV